MRSIASANKIVIKVGTSTLTFENGNMNLKRIEELARVISDIKNSGKDVILVTSGAISVGVARLGLKERPDEVKVKQALAAVGQLKLISIYDEFFRKYNHIVGQVLLTKDVLANRKMYQNTVNTFNTLLDYGIIPVVNENDTISTDEILFGDNDVLSAHVAGIAGFDLLIILTDTDGLYDKDPKEKDAKLISEVNEITDKIKQNISGAGTRRGTGGMVTKIIAAEIAADKGIKTVIINGAEPALIYGVLEGAQTGTYFNLVTSKEAES